ncbi:MAG: hypothetical protein ABFR97_09585 [Thermodesulfobacteriota bacterium]
MALIALALASSMVTLITEIVFFIVFSGGSLPRWQGNVFLLSNSSLIQK